MHALAFHRSAGPFGADLNRKEDARLRASFSANERVAKSCGPSAKVDHFPQSYVRSLGSSRATAPTDCATNEPNEATKIVGWVLLFLCSPVSIFKNRGDD
ncbi:hypothetical protein V2G26_012059 [Clonostachys chloroleuca]